MESRTFYNEVLTEHNIHPTHKVKLMNDLGIDSEILSVGENAKRFRSLPQTDIDRLQHIEHIRWSRFLYLPYSPLMTD